MALKRGYSRKLYLSEKTISNVTAIFKKIGVEDRVHATIFAINNGIEQIIIEECVQNRKRFKKRNFLPYLSLEKKITI